MNKLYNFKTFHESENGHSERPEDYWKGKNYMFSLEQSDGSMYKLTFGIKGQSFLLETPNGGRVIGTINDLVANAKELMQLPDAHEIIKWILHNYDSMFTDQGESNDVNAGEEEIRDVEFKIGTGTYTLSYDASTSEGFLSVPVRLRDFKANSLYVDIPELPLLDDGLANKWVRRELIKMGAKIPKTPYDVGYALKNKESDDVHG